MWTPQSVILTLIISAYWLLRVNNLDTQKVAKSGFISSKYNALKLRLKLQVF